jgi:predicted nucleotidyltransferase
MAKRKPSLPDVINYAMMYVENLRREKLPIEKVFLFGSHVKGRARRWSDVDVCIISSKFRGRSDAIDFLWTRRNDDDIEHGIEPVGFHPKDFIDEDPLAWEIKTTGIQIWPAKPRKLSKRNGKKEMVKRINK